MSRLLYYHRQSNFSRKIRILLREKNLDYQLEEIDLSAKPDYFLKISPIGKVPVLKEEDETVIWDSSLIADYLEKTYPDPPLYSQNWQQYWACRKWEEMADTLGDTIINVWILGLFNQGEPSKYQSILRQRRQRIDRLMPVFEQQLSQTQYLLAGASWSMADIAALCSMGYYDLPKVVVKLFPSGK